MTRDPADSWEVGTVPRRTVLAEPEASTAHSASKERGPQGDGPDLPQATPVV